MLRVVITGGGSGGHVYPALTVMRMLRERRQEGLECVYIGSESSFEKPLREEADRQYTVMTGKLRRYVSWKYLIDPFRVVFGIIQSLVILLKEMPDVVFSKGGYVAIPVTIAAWIYRIPILTHEVDAMPGIANRVIGKFSDKVAVSFKHTGQFFLKRKLIFSGQPVRGSILGGDAQKAREVFGLTETDPVVLVLGGSQGSPLINEKITKVLDEVLEFAQIIHQTGESHFEEVKRLAAERSGVKAGRRGYCVFPFLDDEHLRLAFSVADLVVSRAGGTIFEIAANRKVSILIPSDALANDHQRMNAFAVAKEGAAVVLEENNLTEQILWKKIQALLADEAIRTRVRERIGKFYIPNSAEILADAVLDLAENKE